MRVVPKPRNRFSVARALIAAFIATLVTAAGGDTGSGTRVALTGAHIIGHGPAVLIIREGRIEAITTSAPTADLEQIALDGRFVVPAFIDSHVHLAIGYTGVALARGGIAAAVDLSSPVSSLAVNRKPLNVLQSGPMITAVHGYPTQSWGSNGYGLEIEGVQAARAAVEQLMASGADVIKVPVGDTTGGGVISMQENKSTLSDAELKAVVDQAHSHGLRVAAHAITNAAAMRAATAGADVLAHTPTEPLTAGTLAAWSERAVISTLTAFNGIPVAVENLRLLHDAGATILYGTDLGYTAVAGINGEELELLRKVGLDVDAIIAAATVAPAEYWGFERIGRIVPGAAASFLVLDSDPRLDLSSLTRPVTVYIDGMAMDPQTTSK